MNINLDILRPHETGLDLIWFIKTNNPISTGQKIFDVEFVRGINKGEIIEIRGKTSCGKVLFLNKIWIIF
jgi:hypothetical protein